jgi:hypothetical protein
MTMARKMTPREIGLVEALLMDHPDHAFSREQLEALDVEEMNDGGMGSLKFLRSRPARMAQELSEVTFRDLDGVFVSATLNLDAEGLLFELDIFKGDFSPLREIPDQSALARLRAGSE